MKPVAFLHILDNTEGIEGNEPIRELSFSEVSPFGIPCKDHSEEFTLSSIPLFAGIDEEIARHISRQSTSFTNSWIEELVRRLDTSDNKVLTIRQWMTQPVPLEHWRKR